ncbi:MAG: hypothetical protein WBM86_31665, partial [Waterburya sp.]
MKIAAFNVENLFDRAKIFNQDDEDETQTILDAVSQLNSLFERDTYTDDILNQIRQLVAQLGLERSDEGTFVRLRQIRGRMISRPRNRPFEFKAGGRNDWVGWAELRTASVNEIAVMNTGRVIRDVDADILAVVEAENRVALKQFSDLILEKVEGVP